MKKRNSAIIFILVFLLLSFSVISVSAFSFSDFFSDFINKISGKTTGKSTGSAIVNPSNLAVNNYLIGVNYHAITSDFTTTDPLKGPFLKNYHNSQVRVEVLRQLQSMADSGVDIIKTTIWFVGPSDMNWRHDFPPTSQQIANIKQYAKDVSSIKNNKGNYLKLYLAF